MTSPWQWIAVRLTRHLRSSGGAEGRYSNETQQQRRLSDDRRLHLRTL
jgi:hypothetical protein